MNRKFYKTRRFKRRAFRASIVMMMIASCASGYVLGATLHTEPEVVETVSIKATPVYDVPDIEEVKEVQRDTELDLDGKKFSELGLTAGIATVMEGIGEDSELSKIAKETVEEIAKENIDAQLIRCTGYCDYGVTKSGEYVREGIIAGKDEWLGRTCNLYRVNEDGSMGELIGSYEFLDTGYGIKTRTANGTEGSLKLGKSVDVWHPSEEAVWEWMDEYGEYVYIEFTS